MTTKTTAPAITYRKTKTGQWVAFGPADAIKSGAQVAVTKRDGTSKTEFIATVGKIFTVDGRDMRYGYLDKETGREIAAGRREDAAIRRQDRPARRNNWRTRSCQDCQDIEDMSDGRGCQRHRGNPQN